MSKLHPLASLATATRGAALVEFALSVPVLLLLYLGGFAVDDGLSCNRKVTITTRAVADLITQNASVSTQNVNDILNASTKIMAPYAASNALVRVTEFYTDSKGNTTVYWSQAINGLPRTLGAAYTLPANIKINSTYIVLSEVSYAYKPAVNFGVVGPMTLSDTVYMNPRISDSVEHTT